MLVLLCKSGNTTADSGKNHFKRKSFLQKPEKQLSHGFERYSMIINGKQCYVISAEKDFYLSGNIIALLNAFSGRVLASGELSELPDIKDNLFDIMPYYKKYAAVYFADYLKTLSSSASDAAFFDRSGEYIQYIRPAFSYFRSFGFYTDSVRDFSELINQCYYKYGFKPRFFRFGEAACADVAADIESVSPRGLLSVNVFNETRIVSASYPRYKFNEGAIHLLQNGINRDYITAAFYDNDL